MSRIDQLLQEIDRARREDRLDDALRVGADAIAIARSANNPADLIRALKLTGQIARDLGQLDAALAAYEEAAQLCRAEDDTRALAHTLRHVGDIHWQAGQAALAEPYFTEAISLYRANPAPDGEVANALRPMAVLKEAAGDLDAARALWRETRDLYAAANVEAGVRESAARLARLQA